MTSALCLTSALGLRFDRFNWFHHPATSVHKNSGKSSLILVLFPGWGGGEVKSLLLWFQIIRQDVRLKAKKERSLNLIPLVGRHLDSCGLPPQSANSVVHVQVVLPFNFLPSCLCLSELSQIIRLQRPPPLDWQPRFCRARLTCGGVARCLSASLDTAP